jgi:seryl-tRNA synthetase
MEGNIQDLYKEYADSLVKAGLLIRTSIAGIYGRSAMFERIALGVDRLVANEAISNGAEERFFPPVLPRETLRRTGYMENFPHLCGSVHSFEGTEKQHPALLEAVSKGEDWTPWLSQTDMALCPAACYPLYPTLAGRIPDEGYHVSLWSYVFRHEPSPDPARLQMFRMREDIRVGTPDQVQAWRSRWMERGQEILNGLELDVSLDVANDPFFGRGGKMMGKSQREQSLKFEIFVPVASKEKQTAVASFNYHQDHFTKTFGIELADGGEAHTACIGFGLERVTLGLLKKHGFDPGKWPAGVRQRLWP